MPKSWVRELERRYLEHMRIAAWALLILLVTGCSKTKSVVGTWAMDAPFGLMTITFAENGSYSGELTGNLTSGPVYGTYRLSSEGLEMDPPRITTKTGNMVTPPGGAMRMTMTWIDDNTVELYNGTAKFKMTKKP